MYFSVRNSKPQGELELYQTSATIPLPLMVSFHSTSNAGFRTTCFNIIEPFQAIDDEVENISIIQVTSSIVVLKL